MGSEINDKIFMVDDNGETICEIKAIGVEAEDIEAADGPYPSFIDEAVHGGEISVDVKTRKMSKKRFVKLLMGQGYSRNTSNKMHSVYKGMYGSRSYIGLLCFLTYIEGMKSLGEELLII